MTEPEKIAHARAFILKLANGIDPTTNQPIPETDTLNKVRIVRCLFYVSDLLRQAAERAGPASSGDLAVPEWRQPFSLTADQRANFAFSEEPITISDFTQRLNGLIDPDRMKKLNHRPITDWLLDIGFLECSPGAGGRRTRTPTAQGESYGISTRQREGPSGPYIVTVYDRSAQQFLLDHLDSILAGRKGQNTNSQEETE